MSKINRLYKINSIQYIESLLNYDNVLENQGKRDKLPGEMEEKISIQKKGKTGKKFYNGEEGPLFCFPLNIRGTSCTRKILLENIYHYEH